LDEVRLWAGARSAEEIRAGRDTDTEALVPAATTPLLFGVGQGGLVGSRRGTLEMTWSYVGNPSVPPVPSQFGALPPTMVAGPAARTQTLDGTVMGDPTYALADVVPLSFTQTQPGLPLAVPDAQVKMAFHDVAGDRQLFVGVQGYAEPAAGRLDELGFCFRPLDATGQPTGQVSGLLATLGGLGGRWQVLNEFGLWRAPQAGDPVFGQPASALLNSVTREAEFRVPAALLGPGWRPVQFAVVQLGVRFEGDDWSLPATFRRTTNFDPSAMARLFFYGHELALAPAISATPTAFHFYAPPNARYGVTASSEGTAASWLEVAEINSTRWGHLFHRLSGLGLPPTPPTRLYRLERFGPWE
jgi:hypothetical protein